MEEKRKKEKVCIGMKDDPESKLKAALREDEYLEELIVDAETCDQVDKTTTILVRLNKLQWRLTFLIGFNSLESVPESMWELTNLEELRIDHNQLKGIPSAIVNLTKLKRLFIGGNPFSVFPEAVCKLEQLELLSAYGCQLSALPVSFASLHHMMELELVSNTFERFPEVICELRNLRRLCLIGNKLSSLPSSIVNLRELRALNIAENNFKEFPQVVCELPNLERLTMWHNQLSGVPLAITKLVHLGYLDFDNNLFTSFPLFLGDFPLLSRLFTSGRFNQSARFNLLTRSNVGNPLQGIQRKVPNYGLLIFLKERRVIPRLSLIIASGFFCDQTTYWPRFLFKGMYDPRLFIIIFDFAFDFKLFDEKPQKRGRFE